MSLNVEEVEWKNVGNDTFQLMKKEDSSILKDTDGIVEITNGVYKKYYVFDANGNMLTGTQKIGNDTYYFVTPEESEFYVTEASLPQKDPDNSNLGSLKVVRKNTKWYYVEMDGTVVAKKGWLEIDGKKYYLESDGSMVMNDVEKIDGTYYGFDQDGVMIVNGFCKWSNNNRKYYFGEDGKKFEGSGWELIDGNYYYFEPKGNSWTDLYLLFQFCRKNV